MTQAIQRYQNIDDYLNEPPGDFERVEYADGKLIEMPPESGENNLIAIALQFYFVTHGFFPLSLIRPHSCEIQVKKFHPDDTETRIPDLTILRPEHIALTQQRLTIRLSMPAPLMVAEVVSSYNSPNERNYQVDYVQKEYQYSARGIFEYWIIDPQRQTIETRFNPTTGGYKESAKFRDGDLVRSQLPALAKLQITARHILLPEA